DIVEQIGVKKAKEVAEQADLILYVVDSSKELDDNDLEIINFIKTKRAIILFNKVDLNEKISFTDINKLCQDIPTIRLSAKEGRGIDELIDLLKEMFMTGKVSYNDEVFITNIRHKKALEDSLSSLNMVLDSIEMEMPEDFYTIDLMNVYTQLGFIVGEEVEEDLVNRIFSKFCMGK
ncbi:MAG: tRNA uridine-5-carboxymethylaminomethyl(34) synthesis GTPase MnmE, partial [Lachnospiraceae bacterium]